MHIGYSTFIIILCSSRSIQITEYSNRMTIKYRRHHYFSKKKKNLKLHFHRSSQFSPLTIYRHWLVHPKRSNLTCFITIILGAVTWWIDSCPPLPMLPRPSSQQAFIYNHWWPIPINGISITTLCPLKKEIEIDQMWIALLSWKLSLRKKFPISWEQQTPLIIYWVYRWNHKFYANKTKSHAV